jgi:hypothetical protein
MRKIISRERADKLWRYSLCAGLENEMMARMHSRQEALVTVTKESRQLPDRRDVHRARQIV